MEHIEEICIKLTPIEAKNLKDWLKDILSEYEKQFGEITTSKE